MSSASVPQSVRSVAVQLQPEPLHPTPDHRAKTRRRQWLVRLLQGEEYLRTPTLRADLAEIAQDRVSGLAHQGISLALPLLRPTNMYRFSFPIEIVKAQQSHLAAAKTIYGE